MSSSNHINFRRSIVAVIFLFLNGICVASPFVNNSTDNFTQASSVQIGYDLNKSETTENHLPAQSIRHQTVRRSVVLLNNEGESIGNNIAALHMQRDFQYSGPDSYCLQRPGYYIFIFRYTLF